MKRLFILTPLFILQSAIFAQISVNIISPQQDAYFYPGDQICFEWETENSTLADPCFDTYLWYDNGEGFPSDGVITVFQNQTHSSFCFPRVVEDCDFDEDLTFKIGAATYLYYSITASPPLTIHIRGGGNGCPEPPIKITNLTYKKDKNGKYWLKIEGDGLSSNDIVRVNGAPLDRVKVPESCKDKDGNISCIKTTSDDLSASLTGMKTIEIEDSITGNKTKPSLLPGQMSASGFTLSFNKNHHFIGFGLDWFEGPLGTTLMFLTIEDNQTGEVIYRRVPMMPIDKGGDITYQWIWGKIPKPYPDFTVNYLAEFRDVLNGTVTDFTIYLSGSPCIIDE